MVGSGAVRQPICRLSEPPPDAELKQGPKMLHAVPVAQSRAKRPRLRTRRSQPQAHGPGPAEGRKEHCRLQRQVAFIA